MEPCPVLVGRQRELSALRDLLDAGGGVAMVSGEAGIGKSRLVREFATEATMRPRIVLWARPEEVAQPGPYALIVDLLESIAERCSATGKTEVRALINELTRTDSDGQRPAPAPRAVAAEVRGLVAQLGKPPLIILEDLHWADEQSHSVVLQLARAAKDDKHIVVATLRPERGKSEASLSRLKDSLARDRVGVDVALHPLTADDMAQMLELMWNRVPTEGELAELVRLGEGVPFFIEELATRRPDGERVRVPRSIEQSVGARLADLGDEAARLLSAASLVTGALDVAVLAVACDVPEDRVANHLTAAVRAGLLEDLEDRLVFRHSLVREAIAESLVSVEAAQTHGRLAAAIEKVHAGELDPFAGALAAHYQAAGEKQSAVEYGIRAGERALAFAATEEARTAFKRALGLDANAIGAMRGLAEVEFRDANEAEAATLFRQAAEKLKSEGRNLEAAQVLGRLSWALQGQVDPASVLGVLDEALELLTGADSNHSENARLLVQKGSIQCFLQNETAEARPTLLQALQMAQEAGDSTLEAEALDGLAQADELDGDLAHALTLSENAVQAAKRSGGAEVIGRTHNNHALKLAVSGRPAHALVVLAEGREYLQKAYGRAALGALDVSQAWVSWLMGLPSEVAQLTAKGRVAWRRWRGYAWLLETWSALERGENLRAEAALAEAWSSLGGNKQKSHLLRAADKLTRDSSSAVFSEILFLMSQGHSREAVDAAEVLVDYARREADRFDLGLMLVLKARTQAVARDSSASLATLAELRSVLSGYAYPYLEAMEHEIRAMAATASGASNEAFEHLSLSVNLFENCNNVGDRARCERLLSEVLLADGGSESRQQAQGHLKLARSLAEQSGSLIELNRVEALARQLGLRLRSGRTRGRPAVERGQLSPRELEVAALVAEGETNASIAGRLFLSDRTVQDHITHALKKLNLSSRAALASWAARNGLV
jgi:DNA-binding CsgD family transcriptional regulator